MLSGSVWPERSFIFTDVNYNDSDVPGCLVSIFHCLFVGIIWWPQKDSRCNGYNCPTICQVLHLLQSLHLCHHQQEVRPPCSIFVVICHFLFLFFTNKLYLLVAGSGEPSLECYDVKPGRESLLAASFQWQHQLCHSTPKGWDDQIFKHSQNISAGRFRSSPMFKHR